MKANELRIGNWVILASEKWLLNGHIVQWDLKYFYWMTEAGHSGPDCEGIPLTEEWLIKFGFIELENNHGTFLLSDDKVNFFWSEFGITVQFGSKYDYTYDYKPPINQIHQLQNLFFALTGEELTIK